MKWKAVFRRRVLFPFWPLPVAALFGVLLCPRVHVYWWGVATDFRNFGLVLISLRYLWAMKYGAPVFDWMLWLGLAFGMWVVAAFIVSEVAMFVV